MIYAGAGAYTLGTLQGAGYISAGQRAQIEGVFDWVAQAQINVMPVSTIQATFTGTAATLNDQAKIMVVTQSRTF